MELVADARSSAECQEQHGLMVSMYFAGMSPKWKKVVASIVVMFIIRVAGKDLRATVSHFSRRRFHRVAASLSDGSLTRWRFVAGFSRN
jgi:hypothetical protein